MKKSIKKIFTGIMTTAVAMMFIIGLANQVTVNAAETKYYTITVAEAKVFASADKTTTPVGYYKLGDVVKYDSTVTSKGETYYKVGTNRFVRKVACSDNPVYGYKKYSSEKTFNTLEATVTYKSAYANSKNVSRNLAKGATVKAVGYVYNTNYKLFYITKSNDYIPFNEVKTSASGVQSNMFETNKSVYILEKRVLRSEPTKNTDDTSSWEAGSIHSVKGYVINKDGNKWYFTGSKYISVSGTEVVTTKYAFPLPANSGWSLSSGYGPRWGTFHYGIDLAAPRGTTIKAAKCGKVVKSYKSEAPSGSGYGGYGKAVVIDDGKNYAVYGHMDSVSVSEGDIIATGTKIGTVGNTGNSTGNHLHFELRVNGEYHNCLDPKPLINFPN